MKALLAVFLAVLPAVATAETLCEPSGHAPLPPVVGAAYPDARSALIQSGWQPDMSLRRADYSAAEQWAANAGFSELATCAGTGTAPCRFEYTSSGDRLAVVTEGEGSPIVSRLFFVCD